MVCLLVSTCYDFLVVIQQENRMKLKYLVAVALSALISTAVLAQTTVGGSGTGSGTTGCTGCGGSGEKPKPGQ
jgi:hypothetical protein